MLPRHPERLASWIALIPSRSHRIVLTRHQTEIGEVRRSSPWTNRPELTTSVDLPPEDAVFVLWLAHLIAAREESASTSPMT